MVVAADLEGTLTTGETWKGLGRYLMGHGQALGYGAFFARRMPKAVAAKLHLTDERAFKNQWMTDLSQFFAGMSVKEFCEVAEWVVDTELWPKRREDIIAALKAHQAAGEKLVLVSGTYQPILEIFAERLGAGAVGTPLEVVNGKLTGRLAGEVNVGEAKAKRLHEMLGQERLYATYGDTEADISMMMLGDKPVAVYPDKTLRDTAEALAWNILEP